jgi:transposase IS116/IS110/IS902 family protein
MKSASRDRETSPGAVLVAVRIHCRKEYLRITPDQTAVRDGSVTSHVTSQQRRSRGHGIDFPAGLKLTTGVTDVMGVSGRAMLAALLAGTTDATALAELARGKLRKKLPELQRALQGRFKPHHAFVIEQVLTKIDFLDEALERLTAEIDRRLVSFEPMLGALDTIPGIDRTSAVSIVAETGGDMSHFPTAGHLCGSSEPDRPNLRSHQSWPGLWTRREHDLAKHHALQLRWFRTDVAAHLHAIAQRDQLVANRRAVATGCEVNPLMKKDAGERTASSSSAIRCASTNCRAARETRMSCRRKLTWAASIY